MIRALTDALEVDAAPTRRLVRALFEQAAAGDEIEAPPELAARARAELLRELRPTVEAELREEATPADGGGSTEPDSAGIVGAELGRARRRSLTAEHPENLQRPDGDSEQEGPAQTEPPPAEEPEQAEAQREGGLEWPTARELPPRPARGPGNRYDQFRHPGLRGLE